MIVYICKGERISRHEAIEVTARARGTSRIHARDLINYLERVASVGKPAAVTTPFSSTVLEIVEECEMTNQHASGDDQRRTLLKIRDSAKTLLDELHKDDAPTWSRSSIDAVQRLKAMAVADATAFEQ